MHYESDTTSRKACDKPQILTFTSIHAFIQISSNQKYHVIFISWYPVSDLIYRLMNENADDFSCHSKRIKQNQMAAVKCWKNPSRSNYASGKKTEKGAFLWIDTKWIAHSKTHLSLTALIFMLPIIRFEMVMEIKILFFFGIWNACSEVVTRLVSI